MHSNQFIHVFNKQLKTETDVTNKNSEKVVREEEKEKQMDVWMFTRRESAFKRRKHLQFRPQ